MSKKKSSDVFAENLRFQMRLQGLGQTDLAKKAGLTYQEIYKYLKKLRSPSLSTLDKLATALNVCPASLITKQGEGYLKDISAAKLREVFTEVVETIEQKERFSGLTLSTVDSFADTVSEFGGWDKVYHFLKEENQLRKIGEENFKKTRTKLIKKSKKTQKVKVQGAQVI